MTRPTLFLFLTVPVLIALSTELGAGQDIRSPQDAPAADHVLVEYSGPLEDLEASVTALGGALDRFHEGLGLAKISGLSDDDAAVLAATPGVTAVTRDVIVPWLPQLRVADSPLVSLATVTPSGHDPTSAILFPFQWNMRIVGADDAWEAGFVGDPSVRVAVIDTGIDPFHFDMLGLIDGASSAAFTPSQNLAGPAWGDDHFHGTHVAGSIVTNGFGTSGVAPHTTLIAIKVVDRFENGTFADVIAGILHAVAVDADVINMSLGEPVVRHLPGGGRLTALLNQAMGYAAAHGVLVVSAAGNQATDLTYIRDVAAMPCESGSGICVSATGPTDAPASYSNFGRAVDLSGPGGDLAITGVPSTSMIVAPCSTLSLVPALIAAGCPGNFRYLFLEGTSMATAHVSGAAALVDAQHGGSLNGSQLKSILQVSADDLGMPGADTSFGRGRLNVLDAVER